MMGLALVCTVRLLKEANLLKAGSDIPNLGFIISLWFDFADSLSSYGIAREDGTLLWVHALIAFIDANSDIVITGPRGVPEIATEICQENDEAREQNDDLGDHGFGLGGKELEFDYDDPDWKAAFKAYKAKLGGKVGGTEFDITKMPKREKDMYMLSTEKRGNPIIGFLDEEDDDDE